MTEKSTLYTDSVHYNCKKARFFRNLKKKTHENFGFFLFRPKSQSGGLDLNCIVFEYLMMYLFDFTVIITQNYQIFQFFVFIIPNSTGLIDIK